MNITVNTQILAHELRLLNTIVPTNPTVPMLAHIRVRTHDDRLDFFATDFQIGFSTSCLATVDEPGEIAVPAKRLLDIVEHLPDAELRLVTEGAQTRITCGAFKSRLQTMSAEDFPPVATVQGDTCLLSTAQFQQMIRRVRYAISDKVKYTVNGALFSVTDTVAALVATDGKRLSITLTRHTASSPVRVILPSVTLDAVLALFDGESLAFTYDGRHLFFASDDRLLISRTLDGEFPKYERIIPKNDKKITIDRAALTAALRRVSLLSDMSYAINLTFEPNLLTISSSSADAGEALESLRITYTDAPLKLSVNWQYLLDFLDVASEPQVTLEIKDATSPILLSDGPAFVNTIMLIRVQD